MLSRLFSIILCCWVIFPAVAGAAGLTFGAAPGATRSLETEHQARALAETLADALGDDLTVRLFDNQEQIGQWLNQFAMLDLAVVEEAFLARHAGEFLVLGPVERGSSLFVVARQGMTGNLPQRVAQLLRRDGGMRIAPAVAAPPVAVAAAPPRSAAAPTAKPLLLGFVTGRAAVFSSVAEAELFAARLGERLGTPIQVRPFDSEQGLADWFLRFRMIDLAVIAEPGRRDPLIGDYRQLERLVAAESGGGLLVARRDLPAGWLDAIAQALAASGRAASREGAPVSPTVEPPVAKDRAVALAAVLPPLPAATPDEPSLVAAVPAPARPVLPELPVWPSAPPVAPAPSIPTVAAPAVVLPAEPASPAGVPFEMPASIGPIGDAGRPRSSAARTASPPPEPLPESAVPVAPLPALTAPEPPVAAVEVAAAPVQEIPAAPVPAPSAISVAETIPQPLPELPFKPEPPRQIEAPAVPEGAAVAPPAPELVAAAPPRMLAGETSASAPEQAESVPVVTVAPAEPVAILPETAKLEAVPETVAGLPFVPVPPRVLAESPAAAPAPVADEAMLALAGAAQVPEIIAQPDLPKELRPPGVPLPRPGRGPRGAPPAEEPLLLAKLEKPLGMTPKPPPLLPEPDAEPGVVYVAPFITLMVPNEVRERIFDQFIDTLNQRGAAQKLKFVILKQGLDKIDRNWLAARKYALGEIYGYVEDSGCCSTDLRTRVRLTFYRAHQPDPALKFEYPIRTFFDHDRSTLIVERQKLADRIAAVLVDEMFKALQP